MEFDQAMVWKDDCKAWILLDDVAAPITAGIAKGNAITLTLAAPSAAETISYLSGRTWDGLPDKLLHGSNGIAALTFCSIPIARSADAAPATVRSEPTGSNPIVAEEKPNSILKSHSDARHHQKSPHLN
jgi:hypothetical protein